MASFINLRTVLLAGYLIFASFSGIASAAPTASAVMAGGCFWSMETDFARLPGLVSTMPGYTGGTIDHPTYENHDDSGANKIPHVEAVQIVYDPKISSYNDVLKYYFHHIDPTDDGGQFCDRGASYRPVIFYANAQEKKLAEAAKEAVATQLKTAIKVEILPASTFWPAEEYHRHYADKNPGHYNAYRFGCGRDRRIEKVWGKNAPPPHKM